MHILIDASQPRWSEPQERSIYRYAREQYDTLRFGDKLSVFKTENDIASSVAKARFHVCGGAVNTEELEEINGAEATDGYLAKQKDRLYHKRFLPKLNRVMTKDLPDERLALSSPILEQLSDISRSRNFKPGNKLVVISDLVQNSDSFQFCATKGHLRPFQYFKQGRKYINRLKPQSYKGIAVEILFLQRPELGPYCRDEEELGQFWKAYFKDSKAASVNVIRVRMGG